MKSSLWLLVTMLLLTILAGITGGRAAAQQTDLVITRTARSGDMVTVQLAAQSGILPSTAIKLYEDGDLVEHTTVTSTTMGVAVAVLIDLSGSMSKQGLPGSPSRLEDALEQTIQLAKRLDPSTDMLTVIPFSGTVALPPNPGLLRKVDGGIINNWLTNQPIADKDRLAPRPTTKLPNSAEYAQPFAKSDLSGGVTKALEILTKIQVATARLDQEGIDRLGQMNKVIVIFGDSCDDTSDIPTSRMALSCTTTTTLDAIDNVKHKNAISILSIGVGDGSWARYDQLRSLAEQNGGYLEYLTIQKREGVQENAQAAKQRVDEVIFNFLNQRRHQLVVSYHSKLGTMPSDKRRAIQVETNEQSALTTITMPLAPTMVSTSIIQDPPRDEGTPSWLSIFLNLSDFLLIGLAIVSIILAIFLLLRRRRRRPLPIGVTRPVFLLAVVEKDGYVIEQPDVADKSTHTLTRVETRIGGAERLVDLYLDDPRVADYHATIRYDESGLVVTQEGADVVSVNNQPVGERQSAKLQVYDLLTIGDVKYQLFERTLAG